MKRVPWSTCVLAVVLGMPTSSAFAQEKDIDEKGEVQIGQHSLDLKAGNLYMIQVDGQNFMPQVAINPGYLRQSGPFDFNNRTSFKATFVPQQTQKHTLSVLPQIFGEPLQAKKFTYKFTLKHVALGEKPLLKADTKLDGNDPTYENSKKATKVFPLAVKSGETYVVEMIAKNQNAFAVAGFDPYLVLKDENGKMVMSDDDSAGNLNSRMVYRANEDGQFQVYATTLGENQFGEFTVTIRSTEKK